MNDTLDNNLPEDSGKIEETEKPAVTPEITEKEEKVETTEAAPAAEETTATVAEETVVPASETTPTSEPEAPVEEAAPAVETPEPAPETPVEQSKAEEAPAAAEPAEKEKPAIDLSKLSKEELLDKIEEAVGAIESTARASVESLKQAYFKLRHAEIDTAKKAFLEAGNEEAAFVAPADPLEDRMKQLMAAYKEKRAAILAEEEKQKEANYALKLQLIDQLKALCESQDDFNKLYNEFKEIQLRWKEVKAVPQEHVNELWKEYQLYSEKFYDIIKINNQFRDYDFKKNLEMKTALCETVEKLGSEADVISAFHQLQKLHQQWREIGPVAKDLREDLWARFKAASAIVNKRHQEHFDQLKEKETENLAEKTAICEQLEALDLTALKSFKDWEEKSKIVIDLQQKWKTIGFAPKKSNVKIFERFRAACDNYFNKKAEYYKAVKAEMEKNLALKRELCEKAEALKESTDWKDTSEKLIAIQKEWKTIGPVARKYSDAIWKRFIEACDHFFEEKNKNVVSQKTVEQNNLAAKKELIEKVKALDPEMDHDDAVATLKGYQAEWSSIGFVPFKEKDKVFKEFHDAMDEQFDRLKVGQSERRMQSYRNNLAEKAAGEGDKGKSKLYGEREKMMRVYERMKSELQTYENNIGFLSVASKGGGGLVKEMENKIAKLKEDMQEAIKKIEAIDENLE